MTSGRIRVIDSIETSQTSPSCLEGPGVVGFKSDVRDNVASNLDVTCYSP
jgi:hypothetical protein